MKTKKLPDWVLKYKEKGTDVILQGNNYYLYKITSKWNPEKKRSQKITEKYLGKITPEGVLKPKHERVLDDLKHITVKELGASYYVSSLSVNILELLKRIYPADWKEIFVFSLFRFFYASPLKNIADYYVTSHLSDLFPDTRVSQKSVSALLHYSGKHRGKMTEFMKNFVKGLEFAVIDLTHIFSISENVISATRGYNSEMEYLPQINLVLIFSFDGQHPSFFRLVPGSVKDISIIPISLSEAGIKKAIIIGDKGFYSENNVNFLEEKELEYILPLKRNSSLIDYTTIQSGSRRSFDGYFHFEKRLLWYYERKLDNDRKIIVFLDEKLKAEEERVFISQVDNKVLTIEEFYDMQFRFGTIAIITNSSFDAKKVYELLKSRIEIEALFDTFKNLLHADRSYMRSDYHLEGWMFVNFISLLHYYKLYEILLSNDLLKKYSPRDVVIHLARVHKLRVGNRWILSEIPKATRLLTEKLEIDIKDIPIT